MRPAPLSVRAAQAALLLGLVATGCQPRANGAERNDPDDTPGAEPPPLVRAVALEERSVRRAIETTSFLESEHRVTVLPKIAGRVLEVLVDEGQKVQKGAVLARFDDREARAAVRQVDVQIAQRRVQLDLSELAAETAAGTIEQARLERDRAKATYERDVELDKEGLISGEEVEQSKFGFDKAEEAYRVAQFEARKAELEALSAQAAIDELGAKLEAEEIKLQEHQILSPIDGVVSDRMVRGGETVGAATELFVVVDDDHLVAYLRRPQRELNLIASAREVTFTTDAWPDRTFHAAINVVSPIVDSETGSFSIRIRVARDDDQSVNALLPGMFVRARILTEEERSALMVPKAALLNEGAQLIVFAVRDNVAHRVILVPGIEERDFIECRNRSEDGLQPGDLVVIGGQQSLRDMTAVEIAKD